MIRLLTLVLFGSASAAAQVGPVRPLLLRNAPQYPAKPTPQNKAKGRAFGQAAAAIAEHARLAAVRPWYWEVDDSIRMPFPAYRYIPGQMVGDDDISPVSIRWNFGGKHPLLPALEIAGFQLKAGDGLGIYQKFDRRFAKGSSRGSVWARTRYALAAALRY